MKTPFRLPPRARDAVHGLAPQPRARTRQLPSAPRPFRALSRRLLASALLLLASTRGSAQSSLTWGSNGSGVPAGGSGSWSTAVADWTADNGATYQAWPTNANTVAVFAGTAGTVSLDSAVSVGGLTFGADGYVINPTGSNGITLGNDPNGFSPQVTFTNPGQTATINAPLAGNSGLYLAGGGTLVLGGANPLTGTISLARAALTVLAATGSLNGNNLAMGNALFATGGGGAFTLDNTGATGASAQSLGTLFLYGGDATVTTNRVAAQNLSLTIGNQSRSVGATVNYVVAGGVNGTTNGISLTGASPGFVDRGTFFGGSSYAWKDGAGYLRAISYGADAGTVTTSGAATLTGIHIQATGSITAQAAATFSTLRLSGASNLTLATGATLTVPGILKADGGSATISGGTSIRSASSSEMVIRTNAATDTLTISSVIAANGSGGNPLTKTGLGTLILSGTNTYAGGTYLNAGTLSVATLPAGNGNSSIGTGALYFSGGTLQYTGGTLTTTRQLKFLPGGGGIEVTASNATLTLNRQIMGANTGLASDALVKTGAGTLVLGGGSNTDNSGLTLTVNAGTVQLAKTSGTYNHAVSGLFINNGGTVQLAGTGGDQIYDASAVAVNSGGKLDFNGRSEAFNTLSGGGSITNNSAIANSTMTLGANYDSTTRATFSGSISDGTGGRTMAVTLVGSGTQILGGASTYTGGTVVNGGKLLVNGTGVAGISSGTGLGAVVVNDSGSILGGIGAIQGAVTLNGAAQITGGDVGTVGALTLRGSLTFAGAADALATYLVDLGAGPNNSDRLALVGLGTAGLLDLGGAYDQIAFSGTADGTSSYILATYASLNGTFDNVVNLPAGYALQYGATSLSLVPTAVPEPATWAAGLLTLGAFAYSQRRRFATWLRPRTA